MRLHLFGLSLGLLLLTTLRSPCTDTTYVRFNTTLGNIDVLLYSDEAPNAVGNFLTLAAASGTAGYSNTIIHRSVTGFVIQGGIFYSNYVTSGTGSTATLSLPTITPARDYNPNPPDPNGDPLMTDTTNPLYVQAGISNTRGTIAMALSNGENSGTTSWFFNEGDKSALDTGDGGPFTVFGKIINTSSLSVMDQISNLTIYDADTADNNAGALETTPLTSNQAIELNNIIYPAQSDYVVVNSITVLPAPQTFTAWQTASFTAPQQGNPNFIAATSIPFNDGVPNLLKYVFDINPSVPMSGAELSRLPTVGKTTISGTQYLTLTYHQHNELSGVTVNVQTSPDLVNWTTLSNPVIVQTGTDSASDPIEQVQVPVTGTQQFIRLNASMP